MKVRPDESILGHFIARKSSRSHCWIWTRTPSSFFRFPNRFDQSVTAATRFERLVVSIRIDFYNPAPVLTRKLEGAAMPAKITTPEFPKLTPEELADLVQRERAKGNPLALFAGSWIDPDDPEDKAF